MPKRFLQFPIQFFISVTLILVCTASYAGAPSPQPPKIPAKAWFLIDHNSKSVLAEHNADKSLPLASLTKLMTAYLLFEKLKAGKFKLSDPIKVSFKAWNTKGSRIFIRPETWVIAEDLIKSMIVRSANDATLALVEHVAANEEEFVAEMNARAQALGMNRTFFKNATGLDQAGHYSTARDISRLASALIRDFPDHYKLFAIKEFTYNNIKQYNRNALLWRDKSVDGIKTGRTRSAGYCLIVSAKRDNMRLIAAVIGAKDENGRVEAGRKLLDYGYRNFETRLLYAANDPATMVRVWRGDGDELPLGVINNLYLTLPRGWHAKLRARLTVKDIQYAPIHYGQKIGTLSLDLDQEPFAEYPLVALKEVKVGNILQRTIDNVRLWLQ
ncbi:MAG: D-alanyl-D-alanine carboxypeptidase family protein [Gammaproteobacteria bacterium]|nr:MAG: D-alanyl-D-alanine carboxypeptidase family protein [Gammaproteobacteria bacterium]